MFTKNNNGILNETKSNSSIKAIIIEGSFLPNHNIPKLVSIEENSSSLPSCIVVGCKNGCGNSNPNIKYYQVPNLNTNHISRQWYINTLREDLLDNMLTNPTYGQKTQHFVCIEHFDEESFTINSQQTITLHLKEDAVPSLFEIEVFQKMIAHQENVALNHQEKELNIEYQQEVNLESEAKLHTKKQHLPTTNNSLLSSLLSNDPQSPLMSTSSKPVKHANSTNLSSANKRPRIDPDTRAALIQRVPKAVKLSSSAVLSASKLNNPLVQTSVSSSPTTLQQPQQQIEQPQKGRFQKAVKRTIPPASAIIKNDKNQQQLPINETVKPYSPITVKPNSPNNSLTATSNIKAQKSSKLFDSSLFIKEIPPPIMQSTKRASVNKAVKHTGNSNSSYYHSLSSNKLLNNINQQQPLSQISLNTETSNSNSSSLSNNNNNNNKITITTTYVYKRVTQQPEIDLHLECEEEELIYIESPPSPPPPPTPTPPIVHDRTPIVPLEVNLVKTAAFKVENNTGIKKESQQLNKIQSPVLTKIAQKTEKAGKNESTKNNVNNCNHNNNNNNKESFILIKNDTASSSTKLETICKNIKTNNTCELLDNSSQPKSTSFDSEKSSTNHSFNNIYFNILSKYYSRRQSALMVSLETAAKHNTANSKRSQRIINNSILPPDLRVGHYPAKCNICDLLLDNNIELTSHICSHLESNDMNGSLNTYISPFDAVTTTCSLCDANFSQPFDLIKHLDMKHMSQLDEYKCRICEKQHVKLNELITHLEETHSHEEMPYRCDACGFRTSFYADAIYHIKKEHTSTLRHFCPYCLKSIALPFSEKLGHVQCNLFYSHLITHFNKQENDLLLPSKCKHCSKCILHVRFMRDHLINDHNCKGTLINTSMASCSSQTVLSDIKKNTKKVLADSKINQHDSSLSKMSSHTNKKRKSKLIDQMSSNDEDNHNTLNEHITNTNEIDNYNFGDQLSLKKKRTNNNDSIQDIYDFDTHDSKTNKTNANVSKPKSRRSSVSSVNSTKKSMLASSLTNQQVSSIPATSNDTKQKPVKQTNAKKGRKPGRTTSFDSTSLPIRINEDLMTNDDSLEPQEVTTTLVGNVKFSCLSNMFKCIECGDSNLKCHFKNEYTCHQCFYNTSCSKSFEYHLHGHLVSKRVALWNKKVKTKCEIYKCLCGFTINSRTDNNSNADTGNKVASHLMQCEYKYCSFKSIDQEDEKEIIDEKNGENV